MNLPIDTSKVIFEALSEPAVDTNFETGEIKLTRDKQPVYRLQATAFFEGKAETFTLKVHSQPKNITQRCTFKVQNLVLFPWSNENASGVAYRADAIEAEGGARS